MKILGKQSGVELKFRNDHPDEDRHIIIQLLEEDDEHWFDIGNGMSNYWLDDLIDTLIQTKTLLETDPRFIKTQWGYELKKGFSL